jgi:chemotaxis response regulator CheB
MDPVVTADRPRFEVVAIGASAGGVSALMAVVGSFPRDLHVAVLTTCSTKPRASTKRSTKRCKD